MGRPSTIRHHPARREIESALAGEWGSSSIAEVSRRFGVSESALRRWRDKMALVAAVGGLPAVAPGMFATQILEIVRSLSAVRARSDAVGDNALALRAASAELAAVTTLIDRLGMDGDEAVQAVLEAEAVVRALAACLPREDPGVARRLLARLTANSAPEGICEGVATLLRRAEMNQETTEGNDER